MPWQRCARRAFSCAGWRASPGRYGAAVQNVPAPASIDENSGGFRELLGVAEGARGDGESRRQFLRYLRERGLERIRLAVPDKSPGLPEAPDEFCSAAAWRVFTVTCRCRASRQTGDAALMLQPSPREGKGAARHKAAGMVNRPKTLRLDKAEPIVEAGSGEVLPYHAFPPVRRRHTHSGSPLERLNREIRRRTGVVGGFPGRTCGPDAGIGPAWAHGGPEMGNPGIWA